MKESGYFLSQEMTLTKVVVCGGLFFFSLYWLDRFRSVYRRNPSRLVRLARLAGTF